MSDLKKTIFIYIIETTNILTYRKLLIIVLVNHESQLFNSKNKCKDIFALNFFSLLFYPGIELIHV